jgi:photosystem II stability/assembly factor-like uncharacterized protein
MNDGGALAASPHSPNILFCTGNVYNAAYFVGVSHSTDAGATWEHDTIALGTRGWALAFDPVDSNRVYVAGDSAYSHPCLLVTTDLGATWTQSRTGLSGAVYALAAVPGSATDLYAGTTAGVFKSTDAGASWAATGFTTNTKALLVDPDNPTTVYAGTYNAGVSVSTDGGSTWEAMNEGLDVLKILSLGIRPGAEPVLYAGTDGGAVYRTELYTGVAEQPAPGRARPRGCPTLVRATLRLPGNLPAALHDATGRSVMMLAPGENDVRALPAGLYFVRPLDPGRVAARKVVIQ